MDHMKSIGLQRKSGRIRKKPSSLETDKENTMPDYVKVAKRSKSVLKKAVAVTKGAQNGNTSDMQDMMPVLVKVAKRSKSVLKKAVAVAKGTQNGNPSDMQDTMPGHVKVAKRSRSAPKKVVAVAKGAQNVNPSVATVPRATVPSVSQKPEPYGEITDSIFHAQVKDETDYGGDECSCVDGECGVSCVLRTLSVECGPHCPSGDGCTNKAMQKSKGVRVEIFHTGTEKGFGVRAMEPIKKGTFIMEYIGEIFTHKGGEKRKDIYARENPPRHHFYLMTVTDSKNQPYIIDATKFGNASRFINHSCGPNASCDKWSVERRFRMAFFAKRDIDAGEEITYDYRFENYGLTMIECMCGAPNCRSFLTSKKEPMKRGREESDEERSNTIKKSRKPTKKRSIKRLCVNEALQEKKKVQTPKKKPKQVKKASNKRLSMKLAMKDKKKAQTPKEKPKQVKKAFNKTKSTPSKGSSKFTCTVCSAQLLIHIKQDLMRHVMSHCEEKLFKCSDCDMKNCQRSVITTHIASKHDSATAHLIELSNDLRKALWRKLLLKCFPSYVPARALKKSTSGNLNCVHCKKDILADDIFDHIINDHPDDDFDYNDPDGVRKRYFPEE